MTIKKSRADLVSAKLRWVEVAGELRRVSDFAELSPRDRPEALCPACEARVTLKLGTKRIHHAAHRPGSTCAATNPETALHLNAKLDLWEKLRAATSTRLDLVRSCSAALSPQCTPTAFPNWAVGWTGAVVERRVGSRRPDILLLRNGKPLAAIEVKVSHAVDPEKAADLNRLGLPWCEVVASDCLAETKPWTPDQPLRVSAWSNGPSDVCEHCAPEVARAEEQAAAARAEAARQAEEEAARQRKEAESRRLLVAGLLAALELDLVSGTIVHRIRLVDVFHANGRMFREAIVLVQVRTNGRRPRFELRKLSDGRVLRTSMSDKDLPGFTEKAFAEYLRYCEYQRATTDSPMGWFNLRKAAHDEPGISEWVALGLAAWLSGASDPVDGVYRDFDVDIDRFRYDSQTGAVIPSRASFPGARDTRFSHLHLAAFFREANMWLTLPRRFRNTNGQWRRESRASSWESVLVAPRRDSDCAQSSVQTRSPASPASRFRRCWEEEIRNRSAASPASNLVRGNTMPSPDERRE